MLCMSTILLLCSFVNSSVLYDGIVRRIKNRQRSTTTTTTNSPTTGAPTISFEGESKSLDVRLAWNVRPQAVDEVTVTSANEPAAPSTKAFSLELTDLRQIGNSYEDAIKRGANNVYLRYG